MVLPIGSFANRLVELDAFRLDLLHEGGVVLHVESNVIEHAPSRRRLLRVCLGEANLYSRQIHHRRVVADPRLPSEGLHIPGLRFGDFSFRQEEVDMFAADRHGLRLVFQDFHAHAVGSLDESLVQPVVVARAGPSRPRLSTGRLAVCTLSTMKPTWFTTDPSRAAVAFLGSRGSN